MVGDSIDRTGTIGYGERRTYPIKSNNVIDTPQVRCVRIPGYKHLYLDIKKRIYDSRTGAYRRTNGRVAECTDGDTTRRVDIAELYNKLRLRG